MRCYLQHGVASQLHCPLNYTCQAATGPILTFSFLLFVWWETTSHYNNIQAIIILFIQYMQHTSHKESHTYMRLTYYKRDDTWDAMLNAWDALSFSKGDSKKFNPQQDFAQVNLVKDMPACQELIITCQPGCSQGMIDICISSTMLYF